MMQHHSLSNGKPSILSRRINLAGIGAVAAAAALMLSAESAQAGPKESAALKRQLTLLGTNVTTATPEQLAEAVIKAHEANTRLSPGVLAGEALKTLAGLKPESVDAIVAALETKFPALDAVTRQTYVGDAAKAAGTGPKPNVGFIDDFTVSFLEDGDVVAAATRAIASKAGVGAILAGQASTLADDTARTNLATLALGTPKLVAAATNIIASIGGEVTDGNTDEFARAIALVKPTLLSKIVPGVAATDVQNAGDIINTFLTLDAASTDAATIALRKQVQAKIVGLAKAVTRTADIEQISVIGANIAQVIGDKVLGPNNKPLVGLAATKALTTSLVKAIIAKPRDAAAKYSAANRADEIAEVAAYVVGGVVGEATLALNRKDAAGKYVLGIIQAAIKAGKATAKQAREINGLSQKAADTYVADIVSSVANTIAQSGWDSTIKEAIEVYLTKPANLKKIAGAANAAAMAQALARGFDHVDGSGSPLENGNILGNLVDAETDIRNYTAGI